MIDAAARVPVDGARAADRLFDVQSDEAGRPLRAPPPRGMLASPANVSGAEGSERIAPPETASQGDSRILPRGIRADAVHQAGAVVIRLVR